jgi:hypothetical protein
MKTFYKSLEDQLSDFVIHSKGPYAGFVGACVKGGKIRMIKTLVEANLLERSGVRVTYADGFEPLEDIDHAD